MLELINVDFLWKRKMGGDRVSGELVRLADPLPGRRMPVGQAGVLVESSKGFVVAIPTGIFGFAPYDTLPRLWVRTGEVGTWTYDEFQARMQADLEFSKLSDVPWLEGLLRSGRGFKEFFRVTEGKTEEVRAVYHRKPKGRSGWESDYLITVFPDYHDAYNVQMTIRGSYLSRVKVSRDQLRDAVSAALALVDLTRPRRVPRRKPL